MQYKTLVACASAMVLAAAVACSNDSDNPISPSSAQPGEASAGPNNETLKATAPTPQSPINNAQPQGGLTLVASRSTPTTSASRLGGAYSYEFEIRRGGNAVAGCTQIVGGGGGSSVSYTPTCTLEFDQQYSWRVRAAVLDKRGPWSVDGTFRAPAGGYLNGNELFDPLVSGVTIGRIEGSVTFTPEGARMNDHGSHIRYQLQQPLPEGEFSLMVKGADEGSPGDKSKIFAMQRGDDSDITTNSYRFTGELRGRNYSAPGSISCRMIAGSGTEPMDCGRQQRNFDSTRWYFWKATWNRGGTFTFEVREDGPNGRQIYFFAHAMHGHLYSPDPHNVYVGSPAGRAGQLDATLPGGVYKNVWVSSRPRPAFPGE